MMKTQFRPVFILGIIGLAGFAFPASAIPISNIVHNGGFETGDFTGWRVSGSTSGASARTSAISGGAFGVDHDSAHSGQWGAFAGPSGFGFLSQMLNTVGGATYTLSFWMEGNQSDAAKTASSGHPVVFEVFWAGSLIYKTFDPPNSYTQFTFTDLRATGSCSVLKFGFRDASGFFHLDDVKAGIASRVPEPFSTLWLALPAIVMLAVARFSTKRFSTLAECNSGELR